MSPDVLDIAVFRKNGDGMDWISALIAAKLDPRKDG
jgi:hypothetical protein